MTHVHFEYSDAYGSGSRGSLAFTPHRRHASNETEVLPKPFTVPLLNGEVKVDLRPNPSTWVWIITEYFEQNAESFYTTIPDSDGVVEAVDLIRINPSTIPAPYNAVEPVWWAEMRQYKQTVTDTLLQSEEALTEAKEAIEIGSESIKETQHSASLAKAYANESRESSYASRDYRDEAEQWRDEAKEQADRAASGPESAAQRAEDAAESASNSESASRGFRDEARDSASDAQSSETSANGSASTATERASDARNDANRSESEANRAQGYADELMDGPRDYVEQAEAAATSAQGYRDETESFHNESQTYRNESEGYRDEARSSQNQAREHVDTISNSVEEIHATVSTLRPSFAMLKNSTTQIPSGESTELTYEDNQVEGDGLTINGSHIVVEKQGWVSVSANTRFSSNFDGRVQIRLTVGDGNGAVVSAGAQDAHQQSVSVVAAPVNSGDEIFSEIYQNSGSETNVSNLQGTPPSLRAVFHPSYEE